MEKSFFEPKKRNFIENILSSRFLVILVACIALFNFLATNILPKNIFLVFAADIDVNQLVQLVNSERTSRGLNALTIDSRLVAAAKAKGEDMLAKDYWSHYGPDGESPWQFILASGYNYVYAGENLAKDFTSAAPIHSAWMASPTHKNNIINANFDNIGIASVTGEFQGKETTIVVQMFGKVVQERSEAPIYEDSENVLPETGEEQTLSEPIITEPHNGDILDTGAFDIRGKAEEGNNVNLYDNHELIGSSEISDQEFKYTRDEPHSDGAHSFYGQAIDDEGNQSSFSNIVDITVDTISPYIKKESARFEYREISENFKNFVFSIEIQDNPTKVTGEYEDNVTPFNVHNLRWEGVFNEEDESFSNLVIIAEDDAGNSHEITFSADELLALSVDLEGDSVESVSSKKWFIDNIFNRIFTRSLRGQINFLIIFFMAILLIAQQVILAKTGLTKQRSNSLLHLGVFIILLFVGLLGGGGEIL